MAENQYQNTQDGQETQQTDFNLFAKEAALATDRSLAELLRLGPFNGAAVSKVIAPYGCGGLSGAAIPMVQPNGSSATVKVMPFTAIVGPRVAVSAISTGNAED